MHNKVHKDSINIHKYSDHKPTIHRIPTNTQQKKITSIELQEHRGEHCIEDQRKRRSHLATSYGPVGLVNYSRIIGRATRMM